MDDKEVIEAEVIDETGKVIVSNSQEKPQPEVKVTVLSGISALVFGFLFSLLIALFTMLLFLPLLIIKTFTRKK